MLPIVVPTGSFYYFTAAVLRRPIPFTARRVAADFSSMVETFVLFDHIHYFNIGAVPFEWRSGAIIPHDAHKLDFHPYEAFHGLDFITEPPIVDEDRRILQRQEDVDEKAVLASHFIGEPRNDLMLLVSLAAYEHSYNGYFGEVATKEYPLIKDLIPHIYRFTDSPQPVSNDPMIAQSCAALNATYYDRLKDIHLSNICPVILPPLAALLLSRIPDGCRDPRLFVNAMLELRQEMAAAREHFNDLEVFYQEEATIAEMSKIRSAIEADAKAFAAKIDCSFTDNVLIRFFIDNASF